MASSDAVDSLLNCSICQDLLDKPKMLSCGHTFCIACLERSLTHSERRNEICCSLCRVLTPVGSNGVQGLPTNFAIQDTIEYLGASKKQAEAQCVHWRVFGPPITCRHCEEKFCNSCNIAHIERLRIDSMQIGKYLIDRLKDGPNGFKLEEAEKVIKNQAKKVELEINCRYRAVKRTLLKKLSKRRKIALEMLQGRFKEKIREVRNRLEQFDESSMKKIEANIEKLKNGSALTMESGEIIGVNSSLVEVDEMVSRFDDMLNSDPGTGGGPKRKSKLDFSKSFLLHSFLDRLDEENIRSFGWFEGDNVDNYRRKTEEMDAAIEALDLDRITSIVNNETLPLSFSIYLVRQKLSKVHLLNLVAGRGLLEWVKWFCGSGAKYFKCRSAVGIAALNGHLPVVRYFVELFPELLQIDMCEFGTSLFVAVCDIGNVEMVKVVAQAMKQNGLTIDVTQPVINAIADGDWEIVQCLLQISPAAVNVTDGVEEDTLLHIAASCGEFGIVKLLLENFGAIFDARNANGETCLHAAAQNGYAKIVELLVTEWGSNVNVRNISGETCLHVAARNGHLDVVKYLVDFTAVPIKAANTDWKTALDVAVNFPEVVKYLHEKKDCAKK